MSNNEEQLQQRVNELEAMVYGLVTYIAVNDSKTDLYIGSDEDRRKAASVVLYDLQKRAEKPRNAVLVADSALDLDWLRNFAWNLKTADNYPNARDSWR
ncbi:hypothetical protein NKH41_03270 [Mesorhizobium sp. M1169]|uniref:hypothetical protein n=1 Tax=unclassified Mesorhizobium TaxID=325217 RepID=UPI003335C73A